MTSSIRVLHLINRPQMRGAETFAVRLATRLEDRGMKNAVCSLYPRRESEHRFNTGELETYELNGHPGVLGKALRVDPRMTLGLRRVLRDFKPDLVVGHGSDTLKYASASRLLRRGVKTAYINIGIASFWANSRSKVMFNRFWLRRIDCAVSLSTFTRQDFIDHYSFNSDKTVLIPNAAPVEAFDEVAGPEIRQETRAELGVANDDVVIGMVGNFSPGKGQDTLVNATKDLLARGHAVHLALVGDGSEREAVKRQVIDAGISSHVQLLGLRQDVPRVLRGVDVFALASLSEGVPGVLIEAGLAGVPSVAYDVGGVTEVVKQDETGVVVPLGDYEGFVNALEGLCVRPNRRALLGEQARALCISRFNLNTVTSQYAELFERLVSGSPLNLTKQTESARG